MCCTRTMLVMEHQKRHYHSITSMLVYFLYRTFFSSLRSSPCNQCLSFESRLVKFLNNCLQSDSSGISTNYLPNYGRLQARSIGLLLKTDTCDGAVPCTAPSKKVHDNVTFCTIGRQVSKVNRRSSMLHHGKWSSFASLDCAVESTLC